MSLLCMDVCTCISNMYVCMYVRKPVLSFSTIYLCMCVSTRYVYMFVLRMYVCMYVCAYV